MKNLVSALYFFYFCFTNIKVRVFSAVYWLSFHLLRLLIPTVNTVGFFI